MTPVRCDFCQTTTNLTAAAGGRIVCRRCRAERSTRCRAETNRGHHCMTGTLDSDGLCHRHKGWPVYAWLMCPAGCNGEKRADAPGARCGFREEPDDYQI